MQKHLLDKYNNRIKITQIPKTNTTVIEVNTRGTQNWPLLPEEIIKWIEASLYYGLSVFTVYNTLRTFIFDDEPGENFFSPNAA